MELALRHRESLDQGCKRLLEELLAHCHSCIVASDDPDSLHDARKDIKKARALLRLCRQAISKRDYRQLDRSLRSTGKALAPAREAHVREQTFSSLVGNDRNEFRGIAEYLASLPDSLVSTPAYGELTTAIEQCSAICVSLAVSEKPNAIFAGLRENYKRAQQTMNTAVATGDGDRFHEWRKFAKHHYFHVRLFEPATPELLHAPVRMLDELSDLLGEDHDLLDLKRTLRFGAASIGSAKELLELESRLEARSRQLRLDATRKGELLFAERPGAATRRLRRYWRLWSKLDDTSALAQ